MYVWHPNLTLQYLTRESLDSEAIEHHGEPFGLEVYTLTRSREEAERQLQEKLMVMITHDCNQLSELTLYYDSAPLCSVSGIEGLVKPSGPLCGCEVSYGEPFLSEEGE